MYLGIDLGTSSIKVVLLDEAQHTIGQCSQPLVVSHPKPLWSEQHPEAWWDALQLAMQELKHHYSHAFAAIKAIGLSGQQHGAVLLDAQGHVLRPAILWNDGRAIKECEHFAATVPHYSQIIGARMMPGFTAPKIRWVAKHEPNIFKKIAWVLLPKDYIRFKLSGQMATDRSDASGTGWLDIASRTWSDAMLAATQLTRAQMPLLFEGNEITGTVTQKIAAEWGISPTTILVGGGGDNAAAAMSMNVVNEGNAFLSLGTSGVYFVASDRYTANPAGGVHSFCHCLPNRWHHMTVHLSAASCLTWFANIQQQTEKKLLEEAEHTLQRHHTTVFLPYLSGERSPHNNPFARGVFFGLTHNTSRADMTRAILEGVAFAFADGQEAMQQAGIAIQDVFVVGGGSQSLYWGKILATILNRPLIYSKNREVGAGIGAARLAWLALNSGKPSVSDPSVDKILFPDENNIAIYQEKRGVFRHLYKRLESFFQITIEGEDVHESVF